MKKLVYLIFLIWGNVQAQQNYSERLAATVMSLWKDSMALKKNAPAAWTYDQGLVLCGMENIWKRTGDPKYFNYIQKSMDFFVGDDGKIRTYKPDEFNLDNLAPGRNLLLLYDVTGKEKYYAAAKSLRQQLRDQPRTKEGGYWHKKRYPNQMWLDGLYMGEPFYCEFARNTQDTAAFDDIANQFIWMENHARDPKTGLLYHAWDESKTEKWADPQTGCSQNFWGRAMGWYGMALVDVLDDFPAGHPKREQLIRILQRYAAAVAKVQGNGYVWWQVLNRAGEKGNYEEASASCQFVYALAKAVRMGYINNSFLTVAKKGYSGILKEFVSQDDKGNYHLLHCCQVAGLGGNPYRDGSYDYYVNEPVVQDDPKGLGSFLLASVEMERAEDNGAGKGIKVVLDGYYNNEWRKNGYGVNVRRHYTWDDKENGGFSLFGKVWNDFGATLTNLYDAPTASNLSDKAVYLIVDPDGLKDTRTPHYMDEKSAAVIAAWVKRGGVLLMMTNDTANCDLEHFNLLSDKFGIHFSDKSRNMVKNAEFETGAIYNRMPNEVFRHTKKMYLKEISVLEVKKPAQALISQDGDVIFATARVGSGAVFAVGDPWLYNEYLDGRKIPAEFENFTAARELVIWSLNQLKKTSPVNKN
jgi:unsaturated rhamnogalacturonyl hydrolase